MTSVAFEHFHGAVTRIAVADTAVPHRAPGFNVLITSVWADHARPGANIRWPRETYEALSAPLAGRRYVNSLDDDDRDVGSHAAFGRNQTRLAEIKRECDPHNVFRLNQKVSR